MAYTLYFLSYLFFSPMQLNTLRCLCSYHFKFLCCIILCFLGWLSISQWLQVSLYNMLWSNPQMNTVTFLMLGMPYDLHVSCNLFFEVYYFWTIQFMLNCWGLLFQSSFFMIMFIVLKFVHHLWLDYVEIQYRTIK